MQLVPQKPTTQSLDVALDRPNRLAVQRSAAYSLLDRNTETDLLLADIRKLLLPDQISAVRSALRSTNFEMMNSGEAEQAELAALIAAHLRTIGQGMTPVARKEFIAGALADLSSLPYLLVKPALLAARFKVEFPGKLVVWVYGEIEKALGRLKAERATYRRLLEIAGPIDG